MSEQLVRVEMTYHRDDGSHYRRTITGEEVTRWKKMVDGVCVMAQVHNTNPDWRSVQWAEEEVNGEP